MSTITVNHTNLIKSGQNSLFRERMNAIQRNLRTTTGGSWVECYATHALLTRRKHFCVQNLFSVSDVEELPYEYTVAPIQLCLVDPKQLKCYETDSRRVLNEQYIQHVESSYPGITFIDGRIQLFYIDVISVDQNLDRLKFLTRESAEQALAAFLEAM